MPRDLKPQKVDSISIEERRFDIMLDRNKVEFYITITDDTKATGASKSECVQQAREMVAKLKRYEWTPWIFIPSTQDDRHGFRHHHDDGMKASVVIEFKRLEESPHPMRENRTVLRRHTLDVPEDWPDWALTEWQSGAKLERAFVDGDIRLPYSQATWDALTSLADQVNAARAKYDALLQQGASDPTFLIRALQGARLLGLPALPAQTVPARPVRQRKRNG